MSQDFKQTLLFITIKYQDFLLGIQGLPHPSLIQHLQLHFPKTHTLALVKLTPYCCLNFVLIFILASIHVIIHTCSALLFTLHPFKFYLSVYQGPRQIPSHSESTPRTLQLTNTGFTVCVCGQCVYTLYKI